MTLGRQVTSPILSCNTLEAGPCAINYEGDTRSTRTRRYFTARRWPEHCTTLTSEVSYTEMSSHKTCLFRKPTAINSYSQISELPSCSITAWRLQSPT